MNYLLVFFTFVVLASVFVGVAVLSTDRLFPARAPLLYFANDGIATESEQELPIIIPASATAGDYQKIRFATAVAGYNKDEVDAVLTRLIADNERLARAAAQSGGENPTTHLSTND